VEEGVASTRPLSRACPVEHARGERAPGPPMAGVTIWDSLCSDLSFPQSRFF